MGGDLAENDTVMTRDASAPRFVGGRDGLYADTGGNAADRAELISRQTMIAEQLRQAISNLPAGDAARGRLQAMLDRVRSLHPSQLTAELLNSIDTQADAAYDDGVSDASFDQSYADHVAYSRYEHEEQAYWHQRAIEDYYDNPYVGSDGRIHDMDGFANHYGFQHPGFLRQTNDVFANDPNIHNNPDIVGFRGTASNEVQAYRENPGRTPDEVSRNDHTAAVALLGRGTAQNRDRALEILDRAYGFGPNASTSISGEERVQGYRLRALMRDGYLTPEQIAEASRPGAFNNPTFTRDLVAAGEARRAETLREAMPYVSDRARQEIIEAARARGVNVDQPFERIVDDARRAAHTPDGSNVPYNQQNPQLRGALNTLRTEVGEYRARQTFRDVILDMDSRLTPEQRDQHYYNQSPENRLALMRTLYQERNGQPMPSHVENAVRFNLQHIRTPEETGRYIEAVRTNNPENIERFYAGQAERVLQERVARGDQAAVQDLSNMQQLNNHIRSVAQVNETLARELSDNVRRAAYEQLAATGRVDYNNIAQLAASTIERSVNSTVAPSGRIAEAALDRQEQGRERAREFVQAIQNPNGIQAPSVTPAPPANESPMERAARVARETGATNSTARHNPETPSPAPATPAAAAQEQTAERAREAATAAKAAGTTGGQEAQAAQTPTGGAVRTASNGRAAGSV